MCQRKWIINTFKLFYHWQMTEFLTAFLFVLYKYTVSYLKHTYLEQKKHSIIYIRTVIALLFEMFNDFFSFNIFKMMQLRIIMDHK